jgi:hypothetical protein
MVHALVTALQQPDTRFGSWCVLDHLYKLVLEFRGRAKLSCHNT